MAKTPQVEALPGMAPLGLERAASDFAAVMLEHLRKDGAEERARARPANVSYARFYLLMVEQADGDGDTIGRALRDARSVADGHDEQMISFPDDSTLTRIVEWPAGEPVYGGARTVTYTAYWFGAGGETETARVTVRLAGRS